MIQKFVVEVNYTLYNGQADDPVNHFVIMDGVNGIMRSLRIDGEIEKLGGITVTKVNEN